MNRAAHTLLILLSLCASSSEATPTLHGKIVVAGDPAQSIAHASITLLSTAGELTLTNTTADAAGQFQLQLEDTAFAHSPHLALSIKADAFRPRECNVSITHTNLIALTPTNRFTYFEPVQLNDGIQTGHATDVYLNTNILHQLLQKTLEPAPNGYQELHSLLIYKDGHLVVEEYYAGNNDYIDFEGGILRKTGTPAQRPWSRTDKHYLASVNKTLTATLTGIALHAHEKSPTATIAPLLPDYAAHFADPNKAALTFHHLLTMQLGFEWDEWGRNDLALLWQSSDFTDFLLSRPNNGPQTAWVYNSASPNMLLRALDTLVDGSIRDWAHTHLYQPLGITDYDWQTQPDGYPEGSARMYMRPRDMLKIGITHLNNGIWNQQQIIPQDWINQLATVQVESFAGDYSYLLWHRQLGNSSYLSADGDGGQYINIFPDENMVIVITQGNYLQWPLYLNQAEEMMRYYILPAIETPVLLHLQTNSQQIELLWSTELSPYQLYMSTNLTAPAQWNAITNHRTFFNNHWKITLPPQQHPRFFRLQKP